MIRKLYFVLVLILGLSFNSCTNDISEDVLTNHSSTSSNDEAEIIKFTSGFNIKKENGVYSMGDILLSDEQVKLLDETGSIYPVPNNTLPSDSLLVSPIMLQDNLRLIQHMVLNILMLMLRIMKKNQQ